MIRKLFLTAISLLIATTLFAQNDTLYIMKDGQIAGKYNVLTQIDSIIFYTPNLPEPPNGTFEDERDGNIYSYITIGEQIWMGENLKYLPEVYGPEAASDTDPRYYVFDHMNTDTEAALATENYQTYGVLYNWPAAMNGQESSDDNPSGVQGACPVGWHLPSEDEWTQLTDFLGGSTNAALKLKSETGWDDDGWGDDGNGTNDYNFSALPGGSRFFNDGTFGGLGEYGYWWSSTEYDFEDAWGRGMYNDDDDVYRYFYNFKNGFSIRCIKDN